tara:strand:- start:150 stop:536 length:387 start_codon:yes stop_codon:yes gene_type:complete
MQDPIASLLVGINNAQARFKPNLLVPSSTKKIALLEVLNREGYIESFSVSEGKKPLLTINLKYFNGQPTIKELKRISRPGLREYVSNKNIPTVKGGLGISVISTNKGLMTDKEAKQAGIGGEVICLVF